MKIIKSIILFLFILAPYEVVLSSEKIFIIASYDEDDPCGAPQYKGVVTTLLKSGLSEDKIEVFFLNSKKLAHSKVIEYAKKVMNKIMEEKPRLVITIDDFAFSFFTPKLTKMGINVVFTGINRKLERYGFSRKMITGVYERLFVIENIEFAYNIIGRKGKIAVLYSKDFMGKIVAEQIMEEAGSTSYREALLFIGVSNCIELDEAANMIQKQSEIVAYFPLVMSIRCDSKVKNLTLEDIAYKLTKIIKKPDIIVNSEFMKYGFLGGISADFYKMGQMAGAIAFLVYKGQQASRIPITSILEYRIFINLKRANDLNLKIGSDILNIADVIIR